MFYISALFSGLIFGLGLILSGMTDPSKVIGFLDIGGNWNPALMFVMVGAIAISFFGFQYLKKQRTTLLGKSFKLPSNQTIDWPLCLGAALFGIGWGLAGLCPGPAIVSLSILKESALFVAAMIVGMLVYEVMIHLRK